MSATARLSALDASFLDVESPSAHMHVGWVATFLPPADGVRPSFEELRAHVARRLHRAPRYRQRLAGVPLGLNLPAWVDDERFDVASHVLSSPSRDLAELADMVFSTPLHRERPLWELWIADELADGRIGIVGKVHHCLVDGIAAVELAALLLDPDPDARVPDADGWRPAAAPGRVESLARGVRDLVTGQVGVLRAPVRAVREPRRMLGFADDARAAATALLDSLDPASPAPVLNEPISALRRLALLQRPLSDLRRVKSAFGTTVNDVLLAACAGGVRDFLLARGERPGPLKAMVPVNRRANGTAGDLGNRISFMFVELPCDEADPVSRLIRVKAATGRRKAEGRPHGAEAVLRALGFAPRPLRQLAAQAAASPRAYNLVVSNIPGPSDPLFMRGCRLERAHPVIPLSERHALSIGLTTVGEVAGFGVYADRRLIPDADLVAERIDLAIDELLGVRP